MHEPEHLHSKANNKTEESLTVDELANIRYWNSKTIVEKMRGATDMTLELYRWARVDVDTPQPRTIKRITWEQKDKDHADFQALVARYREAHR